MRSPHLRLCLCLVLPSPFTPAPWGRPRPCWRQDRDALRLLHPSPVMRSVKHSFSWTDSLPAPCPAGSSCLSLLIERSRDTSHGRNHIRRESPGSLGSNPPSSRCNKQAWSHHHKEAVSCFPGDIPGVFSVHCSDGTTSLPGDRILMCARESLPCISGKSIKYF